ncbi:uncharacterized protein [Periplaneta americana]|uniref:uncharacterized protein n=1 Tax=Periplaneta americana TaxID=6978 RepID=UPI0037E9311B
MKLPMNFVRNRRKLQVTEEEKRFIHNAFNLFDSDSDGYLDYYELKSALRGLGCPVKKAEVLRILQTYDKPDGKRIEFDDFYCVAVDKLMKRDPLTDFKYAFKLFVHGKSDEITYHDLRKVAHMIGADITEEEIKGMIDEFDTDGDGKINEAEFLAIMLSSDD